MRTIVRIDTDKLNERVTDLRKLVEGPELEAVLEVVNEILYNLEPGAVVEIVGSAETDPVMYGCIVSSITYRANKPAFLGQTPRMDEPIPVVPAKKI